MPFTKPMAAPKGIPTGINAGFFELRRLALIQRRVFRLIAILPSNGSLARCDAEVVRQPSGTRKAQIFEIFQSGLLIRID